MALLPDLLPAGAIELRRWRLAFLDDLLSAIEASQRELAQWMDWANPVPTREAEAQVVRDGETKFDADREYHYSMFASEGGDLVGGVGLLLKDDGTAEIGYWVRTGRTGRGLATAAARALTVAAFGCRPDIGEIVITMDQANAASAAIPPKLGFVRTGEVDRVPQALAHTGRGWVWTMTRESWNASS